MIVVEGLDGAGKRTLADRLCTVWGRRVRVARFAFPRYDESPHAALARDALYGRLDDDGELAGSPRAMAVLFASDRRDAAAELRAAVASRDVVLVDRYLASNAAYGAARRDEDTEGGFVEWVRRLEVERFDLPVPDHQVLLTVPTAVAAQRAAHRERLDPERARDAYESDAALQDRTARVYAQLAAACWLSPWTVVDGARDVDAEALAAQLVG